MRGLRRRGHGRRRWEGLQRGHTGGCRLGEQHGVSLREELLDVAELSAGEEVSKNIVSRGDSLGPEGDAAGEAEAKDLAQQSLG